MKHECTFVKFENCSNSISARHAIISNGDKVKVKPAQNATAADALLLAT